MFNLGEDGYLLVAGRSLEYTLCRAGRTEDPVIVMLHEGLGCCALWKDFPKRLSRACGMSVLTYSRAGYGRSDSAGLPWPVSYMHDEALVSLPAVLQAAGLSSVVLVGHSDGASIAAIHAGGPTRADIRGLALMAPHFFVEDISIESIRMAREAYKTGNLKLGLQRYHGINTDEAFNGWNGVWLDPDFKDWNITNYLQNIEVPVLGLQGADDEYGTSAQLEAMEQYCNSSAESVLIEDCGHSPHRDQPEKSLKVITKFIAQL